MKCPHCNQEHPDGFLFCPVTGQKLDTLKACNNPECSNYGKHILPLDSRFCPDCGSKLDDAADAENEVREFTVNGVSFTMVKVDGGTFTMGATPEQGSDAYGDQKPAHQVKLSDYYIGETEVTQELWQAVMGSNPSNFKGSNLPVEEVSWNDGQKFRLPTEAEWEYAARGGAKSRGYKYSGSNNIGDVAWYIDNSGFKTHSVKTKSPNELGLYDMSGNVWEWCQDWYDSYGSSAQTNPTGASSGSPWRQLGLHLRELPCIVPQPHHA